MWHRYRVDHPPTSHVTTETECSGRMIVNAGLDSISRVVTCTASGWLKSLAVVRLSLFRISIFARCAIATPVRETFVLTGFAGSVLTALMKIHLPSAARLTT